MQLGDTSASLDRSNYEKVRRPFAMTFLGCCASLGCVDGIHVVPKLELTLDMFASLIQSHNKQQFGTKSVFACTLRMAFL